MNSKADGTELSGYPHPHLWASVWERKRDKDQGDHLRWTSHFAHLQCPCSVLWDYRTVTVISHLQITSLFHCSQKHVLLQRDPVVHWLSQACSITDSDIPQNSLYVRSDFSSVKHIGNFIVLGPDLGVPDAECSSVFTLFFCQIHFHYTI